MSYLKFFSKTDKILLFLLLLYLLIKIKEPLTRYRRNTVRVILKNKTLFGDTQPCFYKKRNFEKLEHVVFFGVTFKTAWMCNAI